MYLAVGNILLDQGQHSEAPARGSKNLWPDLLRATSLRHIECTSNDSFSRTVRRPRNLCEKVPNLTGARVKGLTSTLFLVITQNLRAFSSEEPIAHFSTVGHGADVLELRLSI